MPYIGDVKNDDGTTSRVHLIHNGVDGIIDLHDYQMDAAMQQHNATINREIANTGSHVFWAIGLGFRAIGYWWQVITRGLWGERIGLVLAIVLLIATFVSDSSDSAKANGPIYFALFVVVINVIQWIMKQFNNESVAIEAQEAPVQCSYPMRRYNHEPGQSKTRNYHRSMADDLRHVGAYVQHITCTGAINPASGKQL